MRKCSSRKNILSKLNWIIQTHFMLEIVLKNLNLSSFMKRFYALHEEYIKEFTINIINEHVR